MEQPWINEPNHLNFKIDEFECCIKRGSLGNLNGYIKLPYDHPYYGYTLGNLDNLDINVHGGFTFSEEESNVNFLNFRNQDEEGWVIGFDFAHYTDMIPFLYKDPTQELIKDLKYWTIEEVKAQIENIVEELRVKNIKIKEIIK